MRTLLKVFVVVSVGAAFASTTAATFAFNVARSVLTRARGRERSDVGL
jgi:hypothetical protein